MTNRMHIPIRRAFTLVETLMVVTILAIVAGLAVMMFNNLGRDSDGKVLHAELTEIRNAVIQFHNDTGQSPQRLAELIQPPDQWLWRSAEERGKVHAYDPVTRRGWNGPYIQGDMIGSSDSATTPVATREWKLVRDKDTNAINYDRIDSAGVYLVIVKSSYNNFRQQSLIADDYASQYQLDATDPADLAIRFVRYLPEDLRPEDRLAVWGEPANAREIDRISTGVAP